MPSWGRRAWRSARGLGAALSREPTLAPTAADLALEHRLAMADAIVYATALISEAGLVTSDDDFASLTGARHLPRP